MEEEYPVNSLLKLSSLIDGLTERVGKAIIWLVLVVTLIGAGNAVMRYTINYSSNAFLEIQWYLFSAIFLFGAGYTLMRNEHVRIDLIAGRLSRAARRGSTSSASFSSCCRWRLP
jgi:TRAP-type mannitol/chloroaromatic compound transport system permease small subunit